MQNLWRGIAPIAFSFFVVNAQSALAANDMVGDLESQTAAFSFDVTRTALLLVGVLIVLAILIKKPSNHIKTLLFSALTAVIVLTTVALASATINLNQTSWSKGPVHWHADYEVWACGEQLDLVDPKSKFSNKVGSPSRHEHNDGRLHYEGVVVNETDAALGNFMNALGVTLTPTELTFPTNTGRQTYSTGSTCPNGTVGALQVFALRTKPDQTYSQQKITDPESFIMAPESQVPPGDCIIILFDQLTDTTDHRCRSYGAAESIGKLKGSSDGN